MNNKSATDETLLIGYASEIKGKTGFKRILNASKYSIDGFKAAYRNESAFRQLVSLNTILIITIVFCPFTTVIKMILLFASILSLIVELFNTGLEAAIDHTSMEKHPLAKIAKDVGSAGQFLALALLFVLWMIAVFS